MRFHFRYSYELGVSDADTVMKLLGVVRPTPGALVVLLGTSSGDGSGRYAVWVKVPPSTGVPGQR